MLFASNIAESLCFFLLSSLDAIAFATTVPSKSSASENYSTTEIEGVILLRLNLNRSFSRPLSLIVDIRALAMSTIDDNT